MYQELYETLKKEFLDYLGNFSSWEAVREDVYNNRYNSTYKIEKIIKKYSKIVATNYLDKYTFLKRYNSDYEEFQDYKKDNQYEVIDLIKGVNRFKLELVNVKEDELYFPRFKIVYQMHSALHSIAMLQKIHNTKEFKGHELIMYEVPQFTHIGDKEYVMYVAEKLKLPLVMISRNDCTAFNLMVNGVPKIATFGKYCTRIYKIEPSKYFYKKYFYDYVEKMKCKSIEEITEYLESHKNFERPKKLNKRALLEVLKDFKLCTFCKESLKKAPRYKIIKFCKTNKVNIPNQLADKVDYQELLENFIRKNELIPENETQYQEFDIMDKKANNIVQILGINKHQSKKRAKMNPDLILTDISNKEKGFLIYQCYPLFTETFEQMEELLAKSGLRKNPYEIEYKVMPTYFKANKEVRMGCILCPHKDIQYYAFLKKNHLDRYYYCHLLRTICSAKLLVEENKEYYYYNEIGCPKKKAELMFVM